MSYNVSSIQLFEKQFKRLSKKYPSLRVDINKLIGTLSLNPTTGSSLGDNFYKIRLSISSKRAGKSGGARVITFVKVTSTTVYLASIYDKSEQGSISTKELKQIFNQIEG